MGRYEASDGTYTVKVEYDEYAGSPRTEWDNLGKMVCFHSRYNLGDVHNYAKPYAFLTQLYYDHIRDNGKRLVEFLKQGKAEGARLEYNRHTHEWDLHECTYLRTVLGRSEPAWEVTQSAPKSQLRADSWFMEYMLDALTMQDLLELIGELQNLVILPLYLYDHSGITMNTSGFHCPWDSGQVGWIYADEETIIKEYGSLSEKNRDTCRECLEGEVAVYDSFLTGDCWFLIVEKDGEEIENVGGFIGNIRDCGIEECVPDEARHLLDELTWIDNWR